MERKGFENARKELEKLFQDRVRFDRRERLAYSRDLGAIPDALKKTYNPIPDAVVQPVSPEEVSQLVKLARHYEIPLVPRGAASSGYGGAVPVKGGIVIDLVRMNRVLQVDADGLSVTAEAGVIWQELNATLEKHGLELRLYPTSAPSATVGGWIAQGGTGIGGFAAGTLLDNLIEVVIVNPEGEVETFTGERLRLIYGASGITGIITQAKIKVQPLAEKAAYLVAYPDTKKCLSALQAYTELPLWSATFFNARQIELNEKASQVERLPRGKDVLLLVAPAGKQEIASEVERIAHQYGGEVLPESLAKEEWEERFYPLRQKRLGPSVIPGEVMIPLNQAVSFLAALTEKYPEIAVEGFMCGRDHMAILTYLLGDERQLTFPLKFASSLVILDLATKFGGRPYALGMLLVDEAKVYFGKYYNELVAYKCNHDPEGILNPGKTLLPGDDPNFPLKAFHSAFRAAQLSKGVLSTVGRLFGGNGNDGPKDNGKSKLPADMTWDAYSCAQCGYCRPNCTIFNASPWETNSPRGKWNLLQQYLRGEIPMDERLADLLYTCTTCKRCDPVCQVNIPIVHRWLNIRPQLVDKEKLELTGLEAVRENVLKSGNFFGIPNHKRGAWMDPAVTPQETGEIAYWPGCWASYVMTNMSQNFTRILHKAGVPFVYLGEKETCCGLYFAAGGYAQDFANQVKRNIELLRERGVKTLLCSCPGCFATFKEQYPAVAEMLNIPMEFEVKHITEFLDELIKQNRIQFTERVEATVTFHDSCHLGRWNGIYEEPRNIIRSIPGIAFVEMEHNRENGLCCGTVACFNSLDIAGKIGVRRVQEAEATGARYVVTACAGCGSALNATSEAMGTRIKQKDITDLVCMAMSLPVTDPTQTIAACMAQSAQLMAASRVAKKA